MPVGDTTRELPQPSIKCGDQTVDKGEHHYQKYSEDSATLDEGGKGLIEEPGGSNKAHKLEDRGWE